MRWLLFFASSLFIAKTQATPDLRGLRVDPSYFYHLYPDQSAANIAQTVIADAEAAHVNTVYLYAYNSMNGAFYQTDYPMTEVEFHLGQQNIFEAIYTEARSRGMKVIACISVMDFKLPWQQHPDWRSKLISGFDYKPFPDVYLLSAWHPEFRTWFRGFVADLASRFPNLYAIEAIEPTVDCFWLKEADYNPVANAEFLKRHPQGKLGDPDWKKFRASGATELLAIMSEEAHAKGLLSGVVQTWPARPSGSLYTNDEVRDRVGFNLDEILSLPENQRPDLVMAEFLWQQWAAEYGNPIFTPRWTKKVSEEFIAFVGTRSTPIIHVEISPWHGEHSSVTPTLQEFHDTLLSIKDSVIAIDVYDQSQIEKRDAWEILSVWND